MPRVCSNCDIVTHIGWYIVCWTYRKRRYCKKVACKCKIRTVRIRKGSGPNIIS